MQTINTHLPDRKQPIHTRGWQAYLSLGFTRDPDRTILKHRKHSGPLRVQRPFYPEKQGTCHVYLLHPPGGIVGGDSLDINIHTEPTTDTLITTPAANKFYRSENRVAFQSHTIKIANDTRFEWLPQETIVFDGACVKSKTHIEIANTAALIGWDIVCLGRPASSERFTRGYFKQQIEIWCEGEPLLIDRCFHEGGSDTLKAHWGLASRPVNGLLYCTSFSDTSGLVNTLRDAIAPQDNGLFSISNINNILICRYLGDHTEQARELFVQAWTLLRPAVLNKEAVIPRIWNT